VRLTSGGILEYLGRLDDQVKVHGARIELGEIEHALMRHPDVKDCIVRMHGHAESENQLVAYVVSDNVGISQQDIRNHLRASLPSHMVPSRYGFLKTIPLNQHGKIDLNSLPEPSAWDTGNNASHVAPRTQIEEQVASVWRMVLHQPNIGIHDNFFDLGGHSLAILQVHSKLQKILPSDLSVVDMFSLPTIEALARRLSREDDGVELAVRKASKRGHAAAAALQRRQAQRRASRHLSGEQQ
jgi:hypothetical protein